MIVTKNEILSPRTLEPLTVFSVHQLYFSKTTIIRRLRAEVLKKGYCLGTASIMSDSFLYLWPQSIFFSFAPRSESRSQFLKGENSKMPCVRFLPRWVDNVPMRRCPRCVLTQFTPLTRPQMDFGQDYCESTRWTWFPDSLPTPQATTLDARRDRTCVNFLLMMMSSGLPLFCHGQDEDITSSLCQSHV
ncbi:hypothetical protein KCU93_g380, partial [Aureobasidium melanogenum]